MNLRSIPSRIRSLPPRIRRLSHLLRTKGIRYTYNHLHFSTFWSLRSDFIRNFLFRFTPYPSYIEIEVTTRCNLKCIMCEHTYWDEPNRDMSFEEFKTIIDQFPGLKWIGLTGIGESFINKDFMRMLEYVKSRDILVELYDTFYFIDEKTARRLVEMGVDKIFASIDGATKETYERIRVGSNFDRVINNVSNLLGIKKEMNAPYPLVEFHYIISKANIHEMSQYVELVRSIAGEKATVQFTRLLHEYPEVKDLFVEIPREVRHEMERKAEQLGIGVVWNADVPGVKPPVTECIEWTMPFVFATGHVIPCCSGNEAGHREFQKQTALGNVFEASFKDIWRGESYTNLRRMLRRGEVPIQCRNCCLYGASKHGGR